MSNNITQQFRRETTLENNKKVSIKVLRMKEGLTEALKLIKIIAPSVGGVVDGMRHDEELHGAPSSFTDLALTLCGQLDQLNVTELVEKLLEDVMVDGNQINIDDYFAANYGEMLEVLEFALKENFSSFFISKGISARFTKTMKTLMGQTPS